MNACWITLHVLYVVRDGRVLYDDCRSSERHLTFSPGTRKTGFSGLLPNEIKMGSEYRGGEKFSIKLPQKMADVTVSRPQRLPRVPGRRDRALDGSVQGPHRHQDVENVRSDGHLPLPKASSRELRLPTIRQGYHPA